jgi:hypothetical protein
MNTTTIRSVWNGQPAYLGDAWTLRKRNHVAACRLWSHEFGWELHLEVGEIFKTQVCRSTEEILATQESWRVAMIDKGWRWKG